MQPEKDFETLLEILQTYTKYVFFLTMMHKQYLVFSAIDEKANYTVLSISN